MTQPESGFDPFNASEPILPWQDPGPEVCDNSGESHEAPRRDTSHTEKDAATKHEEDAEIAALIEMLELERERLIEESNIHGAQGSDAPQEIKGPHKENPSISGDDARASLAEGREEQPPAQDDNSQGGRAANRPAVMLPKAGPRNRGCSRLVGGLVWFMILSVAFSIGSCTYDLLSGPEPVDPSSKDLAFVNPYDNEDAEICRGIIEKRAVGITTPDSPQRADAAERITSWMEKRILDDFARTSEELGIDVKPLAELALGALSIDISTVSTFSDPDNPHAQARVEAQALCMYEMYFDFQNNARRYLKDNGLSPYTDDGSLTEEQKTELRSYFDKAFSSNKTEMAFVTFELTKKDGIWDLDENEFSDSFRQLLLLPR